ncbi:MAG: nucleoside triphosphate pyrophosphohydrolase [Candidatus Limnocylindria bacterium]
MVAGPTHRVDELLDSAGLDPGDGVQIVAAHRLTAVAFDPSVPLIVLASDSGAAAATLPGRHARSGAHEVLAALYPASHDVRQLPDGPTHRLDELDDAQLGARSWVIRPLDPLENLASPHGMAAISARLRALDGCPWDRKQTHRSLRPYLLEEAYETVDAIEHGSPEDLAEELGDVLLQVILHAQLAAEEGAFDLTDVYRSITSKIVRRHPHVFGTLEVDAVEQVVANWETIKADERAERGKAQEGAFGGVARALPALAGSREIQERASALGWDWDAIDGVWEKMHEEVEELRQAASDGERLHEIGDVLFALVNLSRWMKLDPEEALREANHRWLARYRAVEVLAAERGLDLGSMSLAEKDVLWDEVKAR